MVLVIGADVSKVCIVVFLSDIGYQGLECYLLTNRESFAASPVGAWLVPSAFPAPAQ